METERKSFPVEFKITDEPSGLVECIVAVFNNVDEGGDIIRYGAFDESVARKLPVGVWSHNWSLPIAKTLETYPIPAGDKRLPLAISTLGGQYVKAKFNLNTQRGKDAFSDIKEGIIDEYSIGYWSIAPNVLADGTRELTKLDWVEWSPVLAGMNPLTQQLSAKGKANDARTLSKDLVALIDGTRAHSLESERVLARVKARHELLTTKQGRELSAQNEAMLEQCAIDMMMHAANITGLLSRVRGEASSAPGIVKALRSAFTKQLPMSPEVQSIVEAIDTLLDALLGEPEETEPKERTTRINPVDVLAMRIKIAEAISAYH